MGSAYSSPLTVSPSYIKTLPNSPLLWEPCLGLFTRKQRPAKKKKKKGLDAHRAWPSLSCRLFGQSTFLAQLQRWKVSARRRPLVLQSSGDTSPACPPGSHVPYHSACSGGGRFDLAILSPSLGRATQTSAQDWRFGSGRDSQSCSSETPRLPLKGPSPRHAPPPWRWPSLIGCLVVQGCAAR